MDFQKDVVVKGIPAYRFTPPRSVLASKEENPDNAGFCVSPSECLGTGLLKVSPCRKGNLRLARPVFLSYASVFLTWPSVLRSGHSAFHLSSSASVLFISAIHTARPEVLAYERVTSIGFF